MQIGSMSTSWVERRQDLILAFLKHFGDEPFDFPVGDPGLQRECPHM